MKLYGAEKKIHVLAIFYLFIAGSFKSQLIDYFRGAITSWELVEGSLWQFYDNET